MVGALALADGLAEGRDYTLSRERRELRLTEAGRRALARACAAVAGQDGGGSSIWQTPPMREGFVEQALRAQREAFEAAARCGSFAGAGAASLATRVFSWLDQATAAGLPVWRCSRCAGGVLVPAPGALPSPAAAMSPWQARLALQLQLLSRRRSG